MKKKKRKFQVGDLIIWSENESTINAGVAPDFTVSFSLVIDVQFRKAYAGYRDKIAVYVLDSYDAFEKTYITEEVNEDDLQLWLDINQIKLYPVVREKKRAKKEILEQE